MRVVKSVGMEIEEGNTPEYIARMIALAIELSGVDADRLMAMVRQNLKDAGVIKPKKQKKKKR